MIALKSRTELEQILAREKYVVLDFTAEWCGPCKMMKPILEWVENSYSKLFIVTVNIDQFKKLYKEYGVKHVPTICFVKDGKLVKTVSGVPPMEEFRKAVRDFLGVTEVVRNLLFG